MFVVSWFTDRGILQKEILDTDSDRLTVFYHDKGFMDAKVGTAEVTLKDDGFTIMIPIEEGSRYRVSDVRITGDPLDQDRQIVNKLELKPKDYFGREKLREDMDKISKTYMDEGYAYTQVDPRVKRDPEDHTADVTFNVEKKEKVHIGRVTVTGNTKTRDKVIRRELQLAEGDLFSSTALERSVTNLKKLDFFEDVEITPTDTEQSDIMNLAVKVKEKLTGSISVGGGFSSDDGLFATGEITQRNLLGRGQYLGVKAYVGQDAQRYVLSFTEPYLFDYPVSGGVDLFNWLRNYPDFTEDATGARLRSGYLFGSYSRAGLAYSVQSAAITNTPIDAPPIMVQQEGRHLYSTITASLNRDSTDHPFLPTSGSLSEVSLEYGSPVLGSDFDYLKLVATNGKFIPLFWKFVGYIRGEFGYISAFGDDNTSVPLYSRFFLGGINSLRGFQWASVGPKSNGYVIGGLTYGMANAEILFPLIEKIGMRGVVFFDAGNAFLNMGDFDVGEFRTDAGVGIRWNSPLGPLRIEWGYNLHPKEGEDQYQFQFSAGAFF
jgi:outer membrane protein insertion porin family